MTNLEQAARALLAKWDAHPYTPWREVGFISGDVANLRKALAEQAEQSQLADASLEPVAYLRMGSDQRFVVTKAAEELVADTFHQLYAAPVRTKDLTDDEINELVYRYAGWELARAVIAKYKEKNK